MTIESEEFYNICQNYRHAQDFGQVVNAYEALIKYINSFAIANPVVKVKKYLVLFEYKGNYFTTADWIVSNFKSKKEFDDLKKGRGYKFINLILESEKEFDE